MKTYYLMIAAFFLIGSMSGQQTENAIPLYEYKFSREIAEGLSTGEMHIVKASQYYSYIGEYQKALSVPNEFHALEWGFDTLTAGDKRYFEGFRPVNAVDAIIERAKSEQIVILNEAHHKPIHRVFTKKLLKGLFKNGYRYFGLEALPNCDYVPSEVCDSLLNERGYPLNSPLSGTYVTEPQMSNLIREAIDIGFKLFPYDRFGEGRESYQAAYIAKVLDQDPDAKILILCGGYHLLESEIRGKRFMGYYLKEKTGIDPFTIYQDILIERNCTQESPFLEMMDYDEEKVFLNEAGDFYNGRADFEMFDALVYHPRTKYMWNRPSWLVNFEGNQVFYVKGIEVGYPCIIKAYNINEGNELVPVDIIEKEYEFDPTVLVLPKGKYRLEITDITGQQEIKEIEVE